MTANGIRAAIDDSSVLNDLGGAAGLVGAGGVGSGNGLDVDNVNGIVGGLAGAGGVGSGNDLGDFADLNDITASSVGAAIDESPDQARAGR